MSFTFQNPVIDTSSMDEKEQLKVMQSWLYQLTDELRHALSNLNAGDIYFENEASPINRSVSQAQKQSIADGFSSLKELITKTADKVEISSDVLRKELVDIYVAQSDFGDYREEMTNTLEVTAQGVEQRFTATEEIIDGRISVNGDIYASEGTGAQRTTAQYIKCGYLFDEGGVRKYGVAVGEGLTTDENGKLETRNLATTMTSDKISFWSDGQVVAYISNNKLYITEAEILGRLKLGNWSIDTDNGFTIQWIGGQANS